MNNFLILTKVFFLSGFNVNKKKQNQKSAFALLGMTLMLFAFSSFALSYLFIDQCKNLDMDITLVLAIILFVSLMLNLVLSMYQLQSIIFNAKDFEFLESLPVTKTCIVSSKLFATYLINLVEDLALIIPCVIIYSLNGGNIVNGLLTIACSLFVSFLPILISTIIGTVSAVLSARSKHSNIVNILVSLLFFVALFGGYMYLTYAGPERLNAFFVNVFFLKWMLDATMGSYISLLYSILFNIGAALIVILFVALLYRPINTKLKAGSTHVDYDSVKKKIDTDLNLNRVLLKKEWLLIYRKPTYFINSILGIMFFLIMGITFLLIPAFFVQDPNAPMEPIALVFVGLIPGMGILMNSIASPASTSVSMEGKYGIEMLKSYPINPKDIIKTKIKISFIMEAILNLFASIVILIIMLIKGNNDIDVIIALFLYPQFAGIVLILAGMLVGLRWPKLDFENDSQVFKNSAAANLPMLFVFLPSLFIVGANTTFYVLGHFYDIEFIRYVGLGSISLAYIILIVILYKVLDNVGPRLFERTLNK